jgi:hypothetical protein
MEPRYRDAIDNASAGLCQVRIPCESWFLATLRDV